MPDAFSVRLASERDADKVWQLLLRKSDTRPLVGYFGSDKAQLAKDLQGKWIKCFLAENNSNNETVGFCLASLAYDTWIGQYLMLSELFVEPEYRGRRLCTALVTAACRFACNVVKAIQVDCIVLESNRHAIEVLQSFGFYNLTEMERTISFRLDAKGLCNVARSELRPGIRMEGFGEARGTSTAAYVVRPGTADDAKDVFPLVIELASLQGFPNGVLSTVDMLARDIECGVCGFIVAIETATRQLVGMTFGWCFLTAEWGLTTRLEDIFIDPKHRGVGIGKAMSIAICLWAQSQGTTAIDLRTQDWNSAAQAVYRAMGFEDETNGRPIMDLRIDTEILDRFLSRSPPEGIAL